MPVRLGVWRAAALPVAALACAVLMLAAGAAAQSPPLPKSVTGFVPTFEIMRTVRAAGFDPLAPPLREGTSYVLRATDYRGILMRVVLDARTGAIRDVTRIVPAASGSLGVVLPPYGPRYDAPYADGPHGAPVEYAISPPASRRPDEAAAPQLPQPIAAPPVARAKASMREASPPLPRPRPLGPSQRRAASEEGAPAPTPSPPAAQAKSPAPVPLSD